MQVLRPEVKAQRAAREASEGRDQGGSVTAVVRDTPRAGRATVKVLGCILSAGKPWHIKE